MSKRYYRVRLIGERWTEGQKEAAEALLLPNELVVLLPGDLEGDHVNRHMVAEALRQLLVYDVVDAFEIVRVDREEQKEMSTDALGRPATITNRRTTETVILNFAREEAEEFAALQRGQTE